MRYLLSLFILLAIPLIGDELFSHFNPETIEKYHGEVLSVQKLKYANRPSSYLQIILHTEKGSFPVDLGPEWYIDAEGMSILPGDVLEVKGSMIQVDGRSIILATKVEKDDYELKLRDDDDGLPLWTGWRRS